MEALSLIALILLTLVGYSAGVSFAAKNIPDPKPGIVDLVLIVLIWGGAFYAKVNLDVSRWLLILIFAVSTFMIAALVSALKGSRRRAAGRKSQDDKDRPQHQESPSLWVRWKQFSRKMGGFQSRAVLSFFYFIVVFPFALIVRIFSDPLRLRRKQAESHWIARKPSGSAPDNFRKQF